VVVFLLNKLKTKYEHKKIFFIGIIFTMVSCQEQAPEIDLLKVVTDLKEQGQFEKANFTFIGDPDKSENSFIKVTFSNSQIKNFNQKEFGEKAARKVYNFSKMTKEYSLVWLSFDSKISTPMIQPTSLTLDLTKNLIYKSSALQ
jgi:hypothetical protein